MTQQQSPVRRGRAVTRVAALFGVVLGLYLIGRAIVEPFVIDMSDPATYRNDWGGPSLLGVLAVHSGPGIIAAAWMVTAAVRRVGRRNPALARPGVPPRAVPPR